MFLNELQKITACLTHHDSIEIICSITVTHMLLSIVYKKYGTRCYTLSYGMASCILISWFLSYKIISTVLFIATTIRILLFLVEHQRYLPAPTTTAIQDQKDWIDTIISLSIQAFHEDISLTWIIDYEERLHEYLHTEINLQVYLVPKLSMMIFNTINVSTKTNTLWINRHGYVVGINPYQIATQEPPSLHDITTWSKEKGVIMVQSYAQKRMYTIAYRGMIRDNLSSHHAYHIIKQIIISPQTIHSQELSQ